MGEMLSLSDKVLATGNRVEGLTLSIDFDTLVTHAQFVPAIINPKTNATVKSDVNKLLKKNRQLNQLDSVKVISHVQRESGEWIKNTLMLEGYDVPFKYNRTKQYRSLQGASVNLTYYPQIENVAGMEFESMKVVRIRRS